MCVCVSQSVIVNVNMYRFKHGCPENAYTTSRLKYKSTLFKAIAMFYTLPEAKSITVAASVLFSNPIPTTTYSTSIVYYIHGKNLYIWLRVLSNKRRKVGRRLSDCMRDRDEAHAERNCKTYGYVYVGIWANMRVSCILGLMCVESDVCVVYSDHHPKTATISL